MYDFYDYFNEDKKDQPYSTPGEELEDYLRLLDMQLESYLQYKGMGNQQKLFSRGLVITESELTSYFEMPPYYRERDICNPVMTSATKAAYDYIQNRVRITEESMNLDPGDFRQMSLLRIEYFRHAFNLSTTEILAVLLAFAVEIDRKYERIFGFLQDNITKGSPTLGLLYALVARVTPRTGSEETLPMPLDERMYTYFFIRRDDQEGLGESLVLQPLVKKVLMGVKEAENSETPVFHSYEEEAGIPVFFEQTGQELSYILDQENKSSSDTKWGGKAVYLGNEDEDTVLHLLYHQCGKNQEKLFVLDLRQLLGMDADKQPLLLSELFLRLKIFNGRLAIRYIPPDTGDVQQINEQRQKVHDMLSLIGKVCAPKNLFLYGQRDEPGELAALYIPWIRIPDPSVALRTEMWDHFLHAVKGIRLGKDISIPDLADFYQISYGAIRKAVGHTIATSRTKRGTTINRKMILVSLQQLNRVDFSGLATYVNPVYTWKDITITDQQRDILKTACNRCRLRNRIGEGWGLKGKNSYGNGISLLLYGPPGTGKTMAAHVIANELELPLYRVDISQISSKYIGETEKNLALIFTAASKANVILFFDEADALFAKRTEVSDSHDKYANNETAYLLQKIEEYDGMSILATNYYNNFDDAFVRRITYAVHMESPDKDTRYALWTTILPKTAKMARNIDFRFLAEKFELSGSNIKAILYNAAYMAGAEGKPIEAEHIIRAMQYEFNKLGKLVNSSDFGKYSVYLFQS